MWSQKEDRICLLPRQTTTRSAEGEDPADLPLSLLRAGESGIIRRLEGADDGFRFKMLSLGLAPGKTVTIARGGRNQPCVLWIDGTRLMMDRRALGRIRVQPVAHPACEGRGFCHGTVERPETRRERGDRGL